MGLGPPPNPKRAACLQSAFGNNIGSIALDAAGFVVSGVTAPESLLAAGVGLGVASASLVNSAAHGDAGGIGVGAVGYHVTALTPAARAAGSGFARFIPGIGVIVSVVSLGRDVGALNEALDKCSANP